MFKFLQVITAIILMTFLLWGTGRDFLPEKLRYSFVGNLMDHTLEQFLIKALVQLDIAEEDRFSDKIRLVSDSDAVALLMSLQSQPNPVVTYFYSPDCTACHSNLITLHRINRDYNRRNAAGKPNVYILAIALADSKEALASLLNKEMLEKNFRSLLVTTSEAMVRRKLEGNNLIQDQRKITLAPYLMVSKQGHNSRRITSGFSAENDLRELLDTYLAGKVQQSEPTKRHSAQ